MNLVSHISESCICPSICMIMLTCMPKVIMTKFNFIQKGLNASFKSVVNPATKLLPLITDVVAIKYSVLLSSCWDRKRSAEISAYVQPPTNSTNVFFVPVPVSWADAIISLSSFLMKKSEISRWFSTNISVMPSKVYSYMKYFIFEIPKIWGMTPL